jgi:hypothetical protein
MVIISGYHVKFLMIQFELRHEMDEVEAIITAWFRDMDAAEVSFMRETRPFIPLFLDMQVATLQAEAVESLIKNIHDVGEVLLLVVSGRVEIYGVGYSLVKNDKDGAPVAAGKRTPQIILHMSKVE